jgi:hypothetical protein
MLGVTGEGLVCPTQERGIDCGSARGFDLEPNDLSEHTVVHNADSAVALFGRQGFDAGSLEDGHVHELLCPDVVNDVLGGS